MEQSERIKQIVFKIVAERQRQVVQLGFTEEHDDQWQDGQLADRALGYCYAASLEDATRAANDSAGIDPDYWPGSRRFPWRGADGELQTKEQMLIKAGALIIAEIERLQRRREQYGEA